MNHITCMIEPRGNKAYLQRMITYFQKQLNRFINDSSGRLLGHKVMVTVYKSKEIKKKYKELTEAMVISNSLVSTEWL